MSNNALLKKLVKNSTVEHSAVLTHSGIFDKGDSITTDVYSINLAFSGKIDGGFSSRSHSSRRTT